MARCVNEDCWQRPPPEFGLSTVVTSRHLSDDWHEPASFRATDTSKRRKVELLIVPTEQAIELLKQKPSDTNTILQVPPAPIH
jgi:hypothetical protein